MTTAQRPPQSWLDYVKLHVRADFENGELFWRIPMKGRRVNKPLGCKDSNGYVKIQIKNRACYAHQVLFFLRTGYWPNMVDHKDNDEGNNRDGNLVETDHYRNMMNSRVIKCAY